MKIQLIALHEGAAVPTRFNIDDVCADLYAVEPVILMPGQSGVRVDFGLILHPDCYRDLAALKVYIRSGLAAKGIMLTNGVGIIEPHFAGYEKPDGSIAGITGLLTLPGGRHFLNGDSDVSLKTFVRGDRVCQLEAIAADGRMVPSSEANYEIVERLTTAQWRKRFFSGRSGFGSTGGGKL